MKRTMAKKRTLLRCVIIALLIAAIAVFSVPFKFARTHAENVATIAAAEPVDEPVALADEDESVSFRLRIIYYRPDGDYDGWNMWIWSGDNSKDFTEDSEDSIGEFDMDYMYKGKYCLRLEIDIEDAVPQDGNVLGILVRKRDGSNWWAEQSADMKLPLSAINPDKITTIYFVQDIDQIFYSAEEALADRVLSATFEDNDDGVDVRIKTTVAITSESRFEIRDGAGKVKGSLNCATNGKYNNTKEALISFSGSVDFGVEYTVVDTSGKLVSATVSKRKMYNHPDFVANYTYTGELGAIYSHEKTDFAVWTPIATEVTLNLYDDDTTSAVVTYEMARGTKGEWTVSVDGDLNGKYYTYSATVEGKRVEVVDPYARSGGRNGTRGMILDLEATNPEGWETQQNPTLASYSQAVVYEAQLRDLTIHESSNVSEANRGKFLGMTEKNNAAGKTPLEYIKELGVTTVHFQPLFDFASVNESFSVATYNKNGEYNWGYDPLNYNMPEGSYSSDPSDGAKRVNEMKQMVMALHNEGLQVVMDVVYNHVSNAGNSNFEALMPGYYFRTSASGSFLNGSGCGNETASERAMFRKFMIDSVVYWTKEYNIDGFRFDLMALHDIKTMKDIYTAVKAVNPDVIIYGEGWDVGSNGLPEASQASKANASEMPNIAVFNDVVRDGLKGSVFSLTDNGYASGKANETGVYVGVVGATEAYPSLLGNNYFTKNPTQSVNYASAHDNPTLWDKLNASVDASKNTLKAMNRLAATSVFTSQGISFFLAGEELLRSKPTTKPNSYSNGPSPYLTDPSYYFSDNSYKSPDSVNAIDWKWAQDNADMVEFYKALIGIKRTFPMFQLETAEDIRACVTINDDDLTDGIVAYTVKAPESDEYAVVILNNLNKTKTVSIPNGKYNVYVKGDKATADKENPLGKVSGSSVDVAPLSAIVMTATLSENSVSKWEYSVGGADDDNLGLILGLSIGIPVAVLIIAGVVFGLLFMKKKKAAAPKAEAKEEVEEPSEEAPEAEAEAPAEEAGEPAKEEPAVEDAPTEE